MEKTLERSVQSILAQSYTDWELIIVDDGSTDGTAGISDIFAQKDSRIKVFHIQNIGVSGARNFGIKKAQGEWIAFIDGDDIYKPNAFSVMMEHSNSADLIVGSFDIISQRHFNVGVLPDMSFKTDEFPDDDTALELWNNFLFAVVWNRLYRRSMLKPIFDTNLKYGEDTVFNIRSFSNFGRCVTLKEKTYVYKWPSNSVMPKALKGRQEILKVVAECFPDNETIKRVSFVSFTKIMRRYVTESFVYNFSPQERSKRFGICREYMDVSLIKPYEKYLPEQSVSWWEQIKCGEYEQAARDFVQELKKQGKPLSDVFVKINEQEKNGNVLY